jgi:hypothetical protein
LWNWSRSANWVAGLLLVAGLDPADTTLSDHFDEILARFRRPDPQPVPPLLLDRLTVLPPYRLLESDLLEVLAGAGDPDAGGELRGAGRVTRRAYAAGFAQAVGALLGHAPGTCDACRVPDGGEARRLLLALLALREGGLRRAPAQAARLALTR